MTTPSTGKRDDGTSRRTLIQATVVLVVSVVAVGVYIWQSLRGADIGVNGYIALTLGIVGTAGLGAGLMALLFYSSRHGYDDQVGGNDPDEKGPAPD
jgi:hypothetical protein